MTQQRLFRSTMSSLLAVCLACVSALAIAAEQPKPIKVGWQPSFEAEFYVAHYYHLFKKVGLKPSFVKFTSGPPMFAALQTGSVDLSYMGTPPALILAAQGVPARTIYVELNGAKAEGLVARKGSGIKSVCDLKGKRVAVRRGSSAAYGMMKSLQKCDFGPSDVHTLNMEITTIIPAFTRKDVDAVWVWEPWVRKLIGVGGKLIATDADGGARIGGVWVANNAWVKKNPETVQRFFKLLKLANQKIKKDPKAAAMAMAKYLSITQAQAMHIVKVTDYPTAAEQWKPGYELSMNSSALSAGKGLAELYRDLGQFLKNNGSIGKVPSADESIDATPLAAYVKASGSQ